MYLLLLGDVKYTWCMKDTSQKKPICIHLTDVAFKLGCKNADVYIHDILLIILYDRFN